MVTNTLLALSSLIWGIHNQGEPQRISIDHFTSGYVMGIPGEDIHPAPALSDLKKITVAVLDTGIDPNHPELKNLIDSHAFNFVSNNNDVTDTHGHGTHISGIIATQATHNAMILPLKVVQTGPNAPIRPQDTEPGAGTALTENVAKAIVYAIQSGSKVINLSMAWPASIRSKAVDDAMKLAQEKKVIVVASAGNDSTSANLYPCVYSNVVCVGAHGPDGAFTYFSNHGSMVDLLAPGIAILSTWPLNKAPVTFAGQIGYEFRNGTSMAAPYVSGAAAELLSRGFTAQETVNRLLLGTRTFRTESLFETAVTGKFTKDIKKESKNSRFGNLDITRALEVNPRSLLIPERKERIEIHWDGKSSKIITELKWVNRWKRAQSATITIGNQNFKFNQVDENQTMVTPVELSITPKTESTFNLSAKVETVESNGTSTQHDFLISFEVVRMITPSTLPANATLIPIKDIKLDSKINLRSVISSNHSAELEYCVIAGTSLSLLRNGLVTDKVLIEGLNTENFLNLYHLDLDQYALITLRNKPGTRGVFVLRFLNSNLEVKSTSEIGTETTVLNENLNWMKTSDGYSPVWISLGYTPEKDKPAFDPWNPNKTDVKMPRIYFIKNGSIRTINLDNDEIPVKILSNKEILIAKGTSYFATYHKLEIDLNSDLKIKSNTPIQTDSYRMLLGLDSSVSEINLATGTLNGPVFSGTSTPGNIRTTLIPLDASLEGSRDTILQRENTLDSLVQLIGAFRNGHETSFFAQTHYDLKFYRSNSNQSQSTSLNRYSYIPSMIFNRGFFPTVVELSGIKKAPAVYIPASLANRDTSEIIVGNVDDGTVSKPASLHFKAVNGCNAIGNLIPANMDQPARQVFTCGQNLVVLPLQIENQ